MKKNKYNWFISYQFIKGINGGFGHLQFETNLNLLQNMENILILKKRIEESAKVDSVVILNIIKLGNK